MIARPDLLRRVRIATRRLSRDARGAIMIEMAAMPESVDPTENVINPDTAEAEDIKSDTVEPVEEVAEVPPEPQPEPEPVPEPVVEETPPEPVEEVAEPLPEELPLLRSVWRRLAEQQDVRPRPCFADCRFKPPQMR